MGMDKSPKDNYDYYNMQFRHHDKLTAKPECVNSMAGCVNCNNWDCKWVGGERDLYVTKGNNCVNRDFPEDADEELHAYINSQN